jgi:hypothetical protein
MSGGDLSLPLNQRYPKAAERATALVRIRATTSANLRRRRFPSSSGVVWAYTPVRLTIFAK